MTTHRLVPLALTALSALTACRHRERTTPATPDAARATAAPPATATPSPDASAPARTFTALALDQDEATVVRGDGTVARYTLSATDAQGHAVVRVAGPYRVAGLDGAVDIVRGSDHVCARMGDGTARCWGDNQHGQLGAGSDGPAARSTPAPVPGLGDVVELAANSATTCARGRDGAVKCFGEAPLRVGGGERAVVRVTALASLAGAAQIAVGDGFVCARMGDGTARCVGENDEGQLGDGTTVDRAAAVPVAGLAGAAQLCAGAGHACARLADGSVECWGAGFGRRPVAIQGIAGATDVACAGLRLAQGENSEHNEFYADVCARTTDGAIACVQRDVLPDTPSYNTPLGAATAVADARGERVAIGFGADTHELTACGASAAEARCVAAPGGRAAQPFTLTASAPDTAPPADAGAGSR